MAYFLKGSTNNVNVFELSAAEFFGLAEMFLNVKGYKIIYNNPDWILEVPQKIVKSFLDFSNTIDDFSLNPLNLPSLSENW